MAKQLDNSEYMGEDSTYRAIVSPDEQVTEIGIENGVPKFKKQDGTTEPFGTRVTRDGADIPSIPVGEPNGLCPLGTDGKIPKEFGGGESWTAFGTAEDNTPPSDLAVGGTFYKLFVPPPKYPILGVDQVGRQDPLNLPRTDEAVGLSYSLNPDGKTYSSDFDKVYPYSDITEVTDSKGNKFVRIPKFYHKFTENSDGTLKIQICGKKPDETWTTCFINNGVEIPYMDIGKYEASNSGTLKSVSGFYPLGSNTIGDFRTYAMANGSGYHQYDIWNYQAVSLLFLVEFATTNSQKIMRGNFSSNKKTGSCDSLGVNATGCATSVTSDSSPMCYRGIENVWGNSNKFIDGINLYGVQIAVCGDIAKYKTGSIYGDYRIIGNVPDGSGYITKAVPSTGTYKQLLVPSTANASSDNETKFYCDYFNTQSSPSKIIISGWKGGLGGTWNGGLWAYSTSDNTSWSSATESTRLCYKPI